LKKKTGKSDEGKIVPAKKSRAISEDEESLGSSNAFDATENPQKDRERELSDEELDDLIDEEK
jgi:hypothetical protein